MKGDPTLTSWWSVALEELTGALQSSPAGLSSEAAATRRQGRPRTAGRGRFGRDLRLLLSQFKSPIILILLFAAVLSFFLHDATDALIILAIVGISGLLGYWQERGASDAVARLLALVRIHATVLRDGQKAEIPIEEVVPGDLVLLSAGDGIPGDCRIVESTNLFVDEAALTGESYPVEKSAGEGRADLPRPRRSNALFLGTHVVSGTASALVVVTGEATELGQIAGRLKLRPPPTEFERGVRRFGNLLLEVTLMLVLAIFAINVFLERPVLESFLFALALAVGLTPQLLPAIISINLAAGAKRMAAKKVIIKRLEAIENFGSMNVLFSDKTGTLTEGMVRLRGAYDLHGEEDAGVLFQAWLNAYFETGYKSPLDEAIRRHCSFPLDGWEKLGEFPYDFLRKRLSVVVGREGERALVTKGALTNVLDACAYAQTAGGPVPLAAVREEVEALYRRFSSEGLRVLGIARKTIDSPLAVEREHEEGMTFLGFLALHDPPKGGAAETVARLGALGVAVKMITGDNRLVAAAVGRQVGLDPSCLLTGADLRQMADEALRQRIEEAQIFAEIEPNQKERILLAAKKAGDIVGFIGDGINDASALHTADAGVSVDSAVDVAREAADIVLLEKDLEILLEGVREGRVTFANTLKYVFMATSANFGNMFSMAGASLFLPFLPLLPKQILLTNLLTDIPEMTIAGDRVDQEYLAAPRRWDLHFIRKFMLVFGLLSSCFDFLTFGVLVLLRASPAEFRAGWFVESVVSAVCIVLVIRSRRPFFRSRPAFPLLLASVLAGLAAVALPFSPLAGLLGFVPLPRTFLVALGLIILLYAGAAEGVKEVFYRRMARSPSGG